MGKGKRVGNLKYTSNSQIWFGVAIRAVVQAATAS